MTKIILPNNGMTVINLPVKAPKTIRQYEVDFSTFVSLNGGHITSVFWAVSPFTELRLSNLSTNSPIVSFRLAGGDLITMEPEFGIMLLMNNGTEEIFTFRQPLTVRGLGIKTSNDSETVGPFMPVGEFVYVSAATNVTISFFAQITQIEHKTNDASDSTVVDLISNMINMMLPALPATPNDSWYRRNGTVTFGNGFTLGGGLL